MKMSEAGGNKANRRIKDAMVDVSEILNRNDSVEDAGAGPGEELLSLSNQYSLLADLFKAIYTYTGTLTRDEIIRTIDTLTDTLDIELNDDFERVAEPDEARFDFAANRPGTPVNLPEPPYGEVPKDSTNEDDR